MTQTKYLNAKQIFEAYGIQRSVLQQLVLEGRLTCKVLETEVATMKLYSVADLDKIIIGGADNA